MKGNRRIVMLGTSSDACGGIASVIHEYKRNGLFERQEVLYLATHCSGSAVKKLFLFLCSWITYIAMLVQGKVQLTHVHSAIETSFWRKTLFLLPTFLFRVPSILHIHSGAFPSFYENQCNVLMKIVARYIGRKVSCIIVVSEALRAWASATIDNENIQIMYNPMGLPPSCEFHQRVATQVLFLGRLGKGKGTYDLLRAVQMLVGRHPHLKLILGGDGEIEEVRREIRRLELVDHVSLLGWVSGAAKWELLQQAGVYVLPSYSEGLPMSILEAMAMGLVVVSTRVGGVPEAVTNGIEGILIPPGDIRALAEAIDCLLENEEIRMRMGGAGRKKAETVFSSELVIPLVEHLYAKFNVAPLIATDSPERN